VAGTERLGTRIKQARTERGWKQKHLAAQVSVEPITVSRWERGATTPDLDVLGVVAEATGKPISFFVDDAPTGGGSSRRGSPATEDAVARIEAAAVRIAESADRLATLLEDVRDDLKP
jgi:transcriptional regulator with XRE-family HTH domain